MPVIVGPSTITINHNNRFVIAQPDASMAPGDDVGFFAQDTRFVSTYGIWINGRAPLLLNALRVEHFSARHEFTTPELPLGTGALGAGGLSLAARSVGLRLDRTISEGVHEDYDLVNYAPDAVRLVLEMRATGSFEPLGI
ncbi:MAG: glycogen debranching N-terminal domain-containing protein [Candidatus Limnocylindrales bacterium]